MCWLIAKYMPTLCALACDLGNCCSISGSEIIQLENIRTATMEEITSVHSESYVSYLEQAKALNVEPKRNDSVVPSAATVYPP
ncbi:hypothetical protein Tco_1391010, partial [Tanacetum coccineum]